MEDKVRCHKDGNFFEKERRSAGEGRGQNLLAIGGNSFWGRWGWVRAGDPSSGKGRPPQDDRGLVGKGGEGGCPHMTVLRGAQSRRQTAGSSAPPPLRLRSGSGSGRNDKLSYRSFSYSA